MSYYKKRTQNSGQKKHGRTSQRSHNKNNRSKSRGRGAYIHPSKFINRAPSVVEAEQAYQATHRFADFPFCDQLHKNVLAKGYETPSAIQDQAIPFILDGKDIIGLANTGTGKTAAFLLPIINKLASSRFTMSVLIMAPTRELAQQIEEQFKVFSESMNLYSVLLVGGSNIDRQISQIRRKPHVIIATPGRTMDLMKRKRLHLNNIDTLVLDEADRMLDMGFINDIRTITEQTPESRQTLFFSATMTPQVKQLANDFLDSPEIVSVKTADTSERVDQDIVKANSKEDKIEKLLDMLNDEEFEKVLLFGETKYGVQRLSDKLRKEGVSSVAIHGNKSQSQRRSALKQFKDDKARVMVATDVAARGLDIPNVSHVINFDQPATYEDYVHRIGRTGRGNATGKALTFVDGSDR